MNNNDVNPNSKSLLRILGRSNEDEFAQIIRETEARIRATDQVIIDADRVIYSSQQMRRRFESRINNLPPVVPYLTWEIPQQLRDNSSFQVTGADDSHTIETVSMTDNCFLGDLVEEVNVIPILAVSR
jgi:hypothetical protein